MENIHFAGLPTEAAQAWTPLDQSGDWCSERRTIAGIELQHPSRSGAAEGRRAADAAASPIRIAINVRRRSQLILRCGMEQRSVTAAPNNPVPRGLKVLAHCVLHDCLGTTWLLVVDDEQLGRETLAAAGLSLRAESVLLVEVAPRCGAATHLDRCLAAAEIDVVYSYATALSSDRLTAVFKTVDDEYTMRVLHAAGSGEEQFNRTEYPSRRVQDLALFQRGGEVEGSVLSRPCGRCAQRPEVVA